MEKEIIDGFDIIKRPLTEEESSKEITLDRFNNYHYAVGECFVDQHGFINHKIFGGYVLCLHPEWNKEILEILNSKYGEALGLLHLYEELCPDGSQSGWEQFYTDLAAFANLTEHLKKEINQILIQIHEVYN
jgi:hypothetical protein